MQQLSACGGSSFYLELRLSSLANFVNAFSMQMLVATLPVYVIGLGGSQADAVW